jgi:hypothetical protein
MKSIISILTLFFLFTSIFAQLDSVIVEKYYISDAKDATDIQYIYDANDENIVDSLILAEGSVTYRVFIAMKPGFKLISIYGDENHPFKISGTSNFFNNTARGANLGKDIKVNKFSEAPTLPVDTWLSLGLATSTDFGVLKTDDSNGSIINGTNGGFLTNNLPEGGIPLTSSDGLASYASLPTGWFLDKGFKNNDTSIFGSKKVGKEFISNNLIIQNSGVMGADPGKNRVLVAQLTTKGEISFELNIQLTDTSDKSGKLINYVAVQASGDSAAGIISSKYLTYPRILKCGCNDRDYREYNADRDCDDPGMCKTKIVFGCTDPRACNYDPLATDFVPGLCCYPGKCADRDISLVCPDLENIASTKISLYPNPASEVIKIEIYSEALRNARIEIYNSFGILIKGITVGDISGLSTSQLDLNGYENGMYMVRTFIGEKVENKVFVKN